MQERNDIELLGEYVRCNSEAAFETLVARHVNLVYSVALRKTGNAHAAEEITQAVFIILAKKARGLSPRTILAGWLCETARLTAANFLRGEIRRQRREQEAYMQSVLNEPEPDAWPQIAPLLDDAIAKLGEKDRNAVVLRFFENKNLRDVGTALGASEDAAKMRVNRALEKLRKFFTKRGVTLSAVAIGGAMAANSVQAAPVGLAVTVTAAAAKGTLISATITTLVKGTMKTITWLKIKFAVGVGVAVLLAGGAATVAISQSGTDDEWTPQEIAKQSQDAYAALSSYSDSGTVMAERGGANIKTVFNIRLQRPNLYRIDWTQTGGSYTSKGVVWSDGSGDFFVMETAGQEKNAQPEKMENMQMALASAMGVSSSAAATIPRIFFKQNRGDVLSLAVLGRTRLKKESDEQAGGVDCFVVSSVLDPVNMPNNMGTTGTTTTTLWIGKRDHLIHQTRISVEGMSLTLPRQSDADIQATLERLKKPATPEAIAAWRRQTKTSSRKAQSSKYVYIQTDENISLNKNFSPADFAR